MLNNDFNIQVNVISTLKKYLKENTNVETISHLQDLVNKVEARNADRSINSDTVLGVLHDNLQLCKTVRINGDWVVTYDEVDFSNGSFIVFASIVFSAKLIS